MMIDELIKFLKLVKFLTFRFMMSLAPSEHKEEIQIHKNWCYKTQFSRESVEIWSDDAREVSLLLKISFSIGLALWAEFSSLRRLFLLILEHV